MAKVKSSVDPFASAVSKSGGESSRSKGFIIQAADFKGSDGKVIFTRDQVNDAISSYTEGHTMIKTGEAMQETSRPVILGFTQAQYCQQWVTTGVRPENPKLFPNNNTAVYAQVSFVDKEVKCDDADYAALSNLIGIENADSIINEETTFICNNEILQMKHQGRLVMEIVSEALREKLPAEILSKLFIKDDKRVIAKGSIDKGIQLLGGNLKDPTLPQRLVHFLLAARFVTQVRVSGNK